jgi:hypothetical protein
MKVKSQESRVKSQTIRGAALVALIAASAAMRSHAQCIVDPVTGQRVCSLSPESEARAPALDARLSALDCPAHCRITVADGSAGSGTLVRRSDSLGIVLTCSHLFDNTTGRIVVTFTNGQRFAARLVSRDRAHDLAALSIRRPDAEPIAVSEEEPTGVLASCGYGPDGHLRCLRGNIAGSAIAAGAVYPSLTITGAARPGDSGGGVLNTSGRLVGVIWGQQGGLTYATCGRPVREFLKRILGTTDRQPPAPPGVRVPDYGDSATSPESESRLQARLESFEEHLKQIASNKVGFVQGLSFGKLLVGALGLSGPVAIAIIIAGGLAGRRIKKRIGASRKGESTASGADRPERQRPIAVDTPPPPQRTVPETHYVSVENDSFAKAHQWASEQVARKYPGATEILQAQDSLIKQYLAAR